METKFIISRPFYFSDLTDYQKKYSFHHSITFTEWNRYSL